jgi:Tol biopolymer transport system component
MNRRLLALLLTVALFGATALPAATTTQLDLAAADAIYLPLVSRPQDRGLIIRVSVASDGAQGNVISKTPSISADGRFVAFASGASNLVEGDDNIFPACFDGNCGDVFVHDLYTGETTLVSVASDGTQGNSGSDTPSISANGRYVAFHSGASNLVAGDTNDACYSYGHGYLNCSDVFVHDRETGETTRVSVASDGTQANNYSTEPFISADGRYVAFTSRATNLVEGDTTSECGLAPSYDNCPDIFVHDRVTGQTTRVSVASDGAAANGDSFAPFISANGRFVAFTSRATNLAAGCTDGWVWQVFVHDRLTRETTRVPPQGEDAACFEGSGAAISSDGGSVAFTSLYGVLVYDRHTSVTTLASVASDGTPGSGLSGRASISADGRFVAFESAATNLVPGDNNADCGSWYPTYWQCPEVFVHDRHTGETVRVALSVYGSEANHGSSEASISADGRFVAFFSLASNLVPGDTNETGDIFVYDRGIP